MVGLIAGALTTGAWLPQLHRSWRSRSTRDLSWAYLLVMTTGIALWLAYGVATRDVAVIAANSVTLLLLAAQLVLKTVDHARSGSDSVQLGEVDLGQMQRGRGDVLSQMDAR